MLGLDRTPVSRWGIARGITHCPNENPTIAEIHAFNGPYNRAARRVRDPLPVDPTPSDLNFLCVGEKEARRKARLAGQSTTGASPKAPDPVKVNFEYTHDPDRPIRLKILARDEIDDVKNDQSASLNLDTCVRSMAATRGDDNSSLGSSSASLEQPKGISTAGLPLSGQAVVNQPESKIRPKLKPIIAVAAALTVSLGSGVAFGEIAQSTMKKDQSLIEQSVHATQLKRLHTMNHGYLYHQSNGGLLIPESPPLSRNLSA